MTSEVATQIHSNTVKVSDSGEIYFEKIGEGKPLILIHAGFSDRRDWMYQISDFAEKYKTINYDQRGFGNSSAVIKAFSPVDDLKALANHLAIEKPILIGHSIGGTIALDFALQYPNNVSALILISSGLNGYVWSNEYLELMQSVWKLNQPEKMAEQFLSAPFYRIAMHETNIRYEIENITKENCKKFLTWKIFDAQDVRWYYPEPLAKLKNLTMPTLIIYGDEDSDDIKKIAHSLNEIMPNVKMSIIKNTDHLINFEKPKELNKLILDFLSGLEK